MAFFFSSKTQWCSSKLIFSSLLFLQSILIHFCSTKALLINIAIDLNLDKSFRSVTRNCLASCRKCFPPGYPLLGFFLSLDAPSQSLCSSSPLSFTTQLKVLLVLYVMLWLHLGIFFSHNYSDHSSLRLLPSAQIYAPISS